MAESNLLSEYDSNMKEETAGLTNVQFNFPQGSDYINDFEESFASRAQNAGLIDTAIEDNGSNSGGMQQNDAFLNFGTEGDASLCGAGFELTQESHTQISSPSHVSIFSNSSNGTENSNTAIDTNNDFFLSNLSDSLAGDSKSSLVKESLKFSSVPTLLEFDNESDKKKDGQIGAETEIASDFMGSADQPNCVIVPNRSAEEVSFSERVRTKELVLANRMEDLDVKQSENFYNLKENNNASFLIREKRNRPTRISPFQLKVTFSDKTNSKPTQKGRFDCDQCSKTFKFNTGLDRHLQKCHSKSRKFKCEDCAMIFDNKALLVRHISTHLGSKSEHRTKGVTRLKCTQHHFKPSTRQCLKKHKLVHTMKRESKRLRTYKQPDKTDPIYSCTLCDFKTSFLDSMRNHAVLHVSSLATACIVCGVENKKITSLIEHLMSHMEDKQLRCKLCQKMSTTAHEYLLHLCLHKDTLLSGQLSVSKELSVSGSDFDIIDVNRKQKGDIHNSKLQNKKSINGKMDRLAIENKMLEICTAGTKLAEIAAAVSFSAEKSKVLLQLNEISALVSELAVVSSKVLSAFKLTKASSSHKSSLRGSGSVASLQLNTRNSKGIVSQHLNGVERVDSHCLNNGSCRDFDIAVTIKEEIQDTTDSSPQVLAEQIQIELKAEALTLVQTEENILKPENFLRLTDKYGKKQLQCTRCQQVFTNTRSLKRHIMVHDDIRPYVCNKCPLSFRRREHLKNHMVTHSKERPFSCSQCPYTAKTEQRLKVHILSHVQTKSYACHLCSYTSRTQYELNYHLKKHRTQNCNQCDFVCYSRMDLKKHMLTHTTLFCKECEFSTSDQAEHAKHMRKHYEYKTLCCELCGYSCNSMKKFKYHKLRHENKTPFQCEECDYKCSSRASFDCHRLKHAGLKPFLCSYCGASFRKSSHLNQHLLIHKDEKAYKCSKCGYSCRTKHNLKEHEMTHSGEKPFSCKYCNFSCRRRKALQIHMEKHGPPPEVNTDLLLPSLPPPYQVNLGVPMMPSLSSIQLAPQVQVQSSSLQVPLQVPFIPSGI